MSGMMAAAFAAMGDEEFRSPPRMVYLLWEQDPEFRMAVERNPESDFQPRLVGIFQRRSIAEDRAREHNVTHRYSQQWVEPREVQ